ncbi:YraN family protein [Kordia sp.]|uniref:YraN family protein n=1 Tax=Kordia sp. TaxID=1965332 RepID=UPI0025BB42A8|nr:YraN family protein [Kordia sp.]MCH2192671.1 YraN family protein [Kordia sp.]
MATHNEVGIEGEKLAVIHLKKQGYDVLETNYRFQKAEVDIIARKKDILVVVEVKTRTSADFGNPEEFVSKKKIQLLVKAIDNYINDSDLDVEVRFDVIAVLMQKNDVTINHIEDAFYHF